MKIFDCRAFSLFETVPGCRETILFTSDTLNIEKYFIFYIFISVPVVSFRWFQWFRSDGSGSSSHFVLFQCSGVPVFRALAHAKFSFHQFTCKHWCCEVSPFLNCNLLSQNFQQLQGISCDDWITETVCVCVWGGGGGGGQL